MLDNDYQKMRHDIRDQAIKNPQFCLTINLISKQTISPSSRMRMNVQPGVIFLLKKKGNI